MAEFSDLISQLDATNKEIADLTATIAAFDTTGLSDADALQAIQDLVDSTTSLVGSVNKAAAQSDTLVQVAFDNAETSINGLDVGTAQSTAAEDSNLVVTMPKILTRSRGGNESPRMAVNRLTNDIWLVWHSNRTGTEEIYASKYFGQCGIWDMPGYGGDDQRVSNFGQQSGKAMFPSVAISPDGEAHVVFQGQVEGRWEIFYSSTTGGGQTFTRPVRVSKSPGDAMMPDVTVVKTKQGNEGAKTKVVIVWHDNRFGNFEIMSAELEDGVWRSSGQDGSDIRITNADGDSMFPRISSDLQGNIRLVYHDTRRGTGQTAIFMNTFVALTGRWDSSGQEGADKLVSNGPADALHPDVNVDHTGGVGVAWHDLRHMEENPDQHEEIYALYCPRLGHPGGVHFPPLQPNIEARLDVDFEVVDCVNFESISLTNAPEVCLMIRAPGATFWRGANEDGEFSDWQQFRPNYDLETTLVPWTLTCVGGQKRVCIQVQDAEMVGFPICRELTLALKPPEFRIGFYSDSELTEPLPTYRGRPVTPAGDVFVKLTADVPQLLAPKFEVVSRGQHLIFNQETEVLSVSGFSGASSAGIGSFIGTTTNVSRDGDVSPAARAFSAAVGREFAGRFTVRCDDGLFHMDGLARLIPTGRDVCGDGKATPAPAAPPAPDNVDDVERQTAYQSPTIPPPPPDFPDPDPVTSEIIIGDDSFLPTAVQFGGGVEADEITPTNVAPKIYAILSAFDVPQRATLKNVRVRLGKRKGVAPADIAGLSVVVDVVDLRDRNSWDALHEFQSTVGGSFLSYGVPRVPVATASMLVSDLPDTITNGEFAFRGFPDIRAIFPSQTFTFGNPVLEPGNYALVFRRDPTAPQTNTDIFINSGTVMRTPHFWSTQRSQWDSANGLEDVVFNQVLFNKNLVLRITMEPA